ncbi:MAG TPA: carboxymuconolactone decarboxylase family protein [Sphingobacterium sp.]|nr:carboxymuconolactone decarboxylase family protein [Sphingobacterium sp.]
MKEIKNKIIMNEDRLFPKYTSKIIQEREKLSPENLDAWRNFSKTVFKEGKLSEETKQLIAIAVAHVTQCPYCIRSHTKQALKKGVSKEEIMEAVWIAAEMRAGAAVAHSAIAIDEMNEDG